MSTTLGKCASVVSSATLTTAKQHGRLFAFDQNSHFYFLIDTGSEVSIVPQSRFKGMPHASDWSLFAANGSPISTHGHHRMTVDFGLGLTFGWNFIIADVKTPIIGADFLRKYHLVPYMSNNTLVHMRTNRSIVCRPSRLSSLGISTIVKGCPVNDLLSKYPQITRPSAVNEIKHNVLHYIETTGSPVHARSRRLAPDRLKAAKAEFEYMLRQGIVRPSNSPWSSPLHMVRKGKDDWRPVGDFRALNSITKPDRYPVPRLHDFTSNLNSCTVFSSVDLVKGYHQIPMAPEDIAKTAVITPFGLYEYLRMPFGLRNSSQTFQRFLDSITRDLPFIFVYIDDILIASKSESEHREHLEQLFQRLSDNGLTINMAKCQFVKEDLNFLGHRVTISGFEPLPEKVNDLRNFPQPTSKKQLRRFLGMANFYRPFQKAVAGKLQPMYNLLIGKERELTWTEEASRAFELTKASLAEMTLLHYHSGSLLSLQTDASLTAVGAVLQQHVNDSWQPLAYFSKALKPPQMKYSAFDRELFAIYKSLQHFRYMLEGRQFLILTDHKPLTTAIGSATERTPRQLTYLNYISEFSAEVRHVAGSSNVVADALSRFNTDAIASSAWSIEELATEQMADPELALSRNSASLKPVQITPTHKIIVDTSKSTHRPYVPMTLRRRCFDSIHGLRHSGIKDTKKQINTRFFWPSITKDVQNWVKTCTRCQTSKITRHTHIPPTQIAMPDTRFAHIHIDLVGPFSVSKGNTYILTMMDRFTRWPEAVPLSNMEATTVTEAILCHWISRFGKPAIITTDQGRQFISQHFRSFCQRFGIDHRLTSAYNPQADGLVERFHRTFKDSLRCLNDDPHWTSQLPLVLLGIRSAFKQDLKTSSAELVYGTTLKLPVEIIIEQSDPDPKSFADSLTAIMNKLKPTGTRVKQSTIVIPTELINCKHVLVRVDCHRKPLDRPYRGPYEVIKRNEHTFTIRTPNGTEDVNIRRLKATQVDPQTVTFNIPNKRGRPRKNPG